MIENILESSGFSKKEADIYIRLYTFGQQSIATLASSLEMSVSTVDYICKRLEKRSLTRSRKKEGVILWNALPLEKMIGSVEEEIQAMSRKKALLTKALAEMSHINNIGANLPKIMYSQGMNEVVKAYVDFFSPLPIGSTVYDYVSTFSDERMNLNREAIIQACIKKRKERRIHVKCISTLSALALDLKEGDITSNRETFFVPKPYSGAHETLISDTSTLELSYSKKGVFSILTQHSEVANMRKNIFLLAWRMAKKDDAKLWDSKKAKLTKRGEKVIHLERSGSFDAD